MNDVRLHGVYAITDPDLCGKYLIENVEAAIKGGIRILQYRNKQTARSMQIEEATKLMALCRQYNILFIVNDDIDLANDVKADGVHLGQSDASLLQAREKLGENKIIGVSCNNRLEYALTAQEQGADYVAFGRFFNSLTKPEAPQADIELLSRAANELHIPIVAIGGITPDNAQILINAGADMLAVIHGIFGQTNIQLAAQRYADLFRN